MTQHEWRSVWPLALAVVVSYSAVLGGNYLFHDDYYLMAVSGGHCTDHPQYRAYMNDYGRPGAIYLKCFFAKLFDEPSGAYLPRGLTIIVLAAIGLVVYRVLRPYVSPLFAGLSAAAIITLPPFQTPAVMLANAPHVYAALLGLVAGWLVTSGTDAPRMIAAAVLALAGLFIYQPAPFLYLMPVALVVLFRPMLDTRALLRSTITLAAPLVGAIGIYALWFASLHSKRGAGSFDIVGKAYWFATEAAPRILSFWFLDSNMIGAVAFIAVLAVLAVRKRDQGAIVSVRAAVAAGLVLFSYLPNLASSESILFYRTAIAIQPITLACLCCLLYRTRFAHGVVAAAALTGTVLAYWHVKGLYVVPQTIELAYLRESLRDVDFATVPNIHVVRPARLLTTGTEYGDEFGPMTSRAPQDLPYMFLAASRQLGRPPIRLTTGLTRQTFDFPGLDFPPKRTAPIPAGSVIIDYNEICAFMKERGMSARYNICTHQASP